MINKFQVRRYEAGEDFNFIRLRGDGIVVFFAGEFGGVFFSLI